MEKILFALSLFGLFYSLTIKRFPTQEKIRTLLLYYALPATSALVTFILTTALFQTPFAGMPWGLVGWFVPSTLVEIRHNKKQKRLKELTKQFITSAAGLYSAGQMTSDVVRNMAEAFPEPFSTEFEDMVRKRNLSSHASFPRMFKDMADKYNLEEFEAVASIIAASERAGGPKAVSKGFKRLSHALRQRDKLIAERIKATLEPRIAAIFVIATVSIGLLIDATLLRDYYMNGTGRLLLTVSSILLVIIIVIMKKVSHSPDL